MMSQHLTSMFEQIGNFTKNNLTHNSKLKEREKERENKASANHVGNQQPSPSNKHGQQLLPLKKPFKLRNVASKAESYDTLHANVTTLDGCFKELFIVDYQLIHYGCPIRDLAYLMYTSTDRQFREKYFSHIKAYHYKAMEKFLQHFSIEIEDVFPREVYEKQFLKARECGLSRVLMFSILGYASETAYLEFGNKEIRDQTVKMDGIFQKLIKEFVDEYFEFGYMVAENSSV